MIPHHRCRAISAAAIAIAATLAAASQADADYLLDFDPPSMTAGPRASFSVDVFLEQTGGMTALDDGLISAAFTVLYSASSASELAIVTDVAPNAEFDDVVELSNTYAPGSSSGTVVVRLNDLFGVSATADRIVLATLTLMAPSGTGITTLTALPYDPSPTGVNFSTVFEDLDPVGEGSARVSVSGAVVPEPATLGMVLLGSAITAGLGWGRRRRAA